MDAGDSLLFEEVPAAAGCIVAVATLNSEATLNALSLPMALELDRQLAAWAARDDIASVLLRGAGARAFCAGGDIQDLYGAMAANHAAGAWVDDFPDRFFEAEYRVDYRIHRYPKPVVAFGQGFVMGGGLGLFSAAQVRLATPKTRIAMPEVTIGLFPDAGATWILRNLPLHLGLFMGATGCRIDAADAMHIGLATHVLPVDGDPLAMLVAAAGDPDAAFRHLPMHESPSALERAGDDLADCLGALPESASEARWALGTLSGRNDRIDQALKTMRSGCPTTIGIVCEQLRRAPKMDLEACFRMEMTIAGNCARFPDFAEGVRALIIDKDGAPRWRFDGDQEHVLAHFDPPWDTNPLEDLPGGGGR